MACTFFGHRYVQKEIEPILRSTLIDLIENHGAELFYVGNQGGFDAMVTRVLRELSDRYPIRAYTVLAYLPTSESSVSENLMPTVLPEGIETVPRRFAISFRNRWMIMQSDIVVTHVTNHVASGAAQFKALAEKQGKTVINLSAF
ncbi:MAG: hypothetical protein IKP26_05635 [Clostridia bacterium]|nr:hypothetical protein [Clostridia bacterium]